MFVCVYFEIICDIADLVLSFMCGCSNESISNLYVWRSLGPVYLCMFMHSEVDADTLYCSLINNAFDLI